MEKSCQLDDFNPLATVEEIQKRLARPPTLHSQTASTFISSNRRLEDYLHPVLLSVARVKTGRKRKVLEGKVKTAMKNDEKKEFEWFDQLRNFSGVAEADEERTKTNDAVDLNCDSDSIFGGGGAEEEEHADGSPYRRFEETALKRFKG